MRVRSMIVLLTLALGAGLLAACGGDGDGAGSDGDGTIEIRAFDIGFEPTSVEVAAGETVTFVVTNDGAVEHEFVLGPEHIQMEHEGGMGEGMEHDEMTEDAMEGWPALTLAPGATEEVTHTFEEAGEVLFGCHVEGHYAAGMKGTVTVG